MERGFLTNYIKLPIVSEGDISPENYLTMHTDKWYKDVEKSDNTYWIIECIGYLTAWKDIYPNFAKLCNDRIDKLCITLDKILRERKEQVCGKNL